MLWNLNLNIVTKFNAQRKYFVSVFNDNCIVNDDWESILVKFVYDLSLGMLH